MTAVAGNLAALFLVGDATSAVLVYLGAILLAAATLIFWLAHPRRQPGS
jgi:hypothetical protein